jgi:hypothetical protein
VTATELEQRATALFGEQWQTALARRIRVEPRTVRRWKAGDRDIPDWLAVMLELLEFQAATMDRR